jgi:predicted enzyme related to lactoylglutathione lyase
VSAAQKTSPDLLANVDVDDLERGVDFYHRGLGLREGRRLFDNTVAEMLGATGPIYLMSKARGSAAFSNASVVRDYRRHWTPVHLDFVVDDVHSAVRKACAAGAKAETEVQENSWGRIATLSDPFGNGFCILEFVGRGYDEVAADETSRGDTQDS